MKLFILAAETLDGRGHILLMVYSHISQQAFLHQEIF